jgi:hypothetical protein
MAFLTPAQRLDQLIDQMEADGFDVSTLREVSVGYDALATAAASISNRRQATEWAKRIGSADDNSH